LIVIIIIIISMFIQVNTLHYLQIYYIHIYS